MNLIEYISEFENELCLEEKSEHTIKKYLRDVSAFVDYIATNEISKEHVIEYKKYLAEQFKATGVNSRLVAINRFLQFIGKPDCAVKLLKVQRQLFMNENREMTIEEYKRLINAAGNTRIGYIIQTICGTGIRISELKYITVEAVKIGKTVIECKNKRRTIFIPTQLQKQLNKYIKENKITTGSVFVTKNGKPLDRCNVWKAMKALCERAKVNAEKVFPHNLRHLFARIFYGIDKDIVRLADVLGHSSVDTTRIYTRESGEKHRGFLEKVNMILMTT